MQLNYDDRARISSYAATKNDVYLYYFNHHSSQSLWPKWMGVLHGDEIFYVFGEPLNKTHFRYTKEEVQLSKTMMTYWANFAKTGNPNTFSNGSWTPTYWPIHTERNKEFLMLSTNNLTTGRGHRARKCAFWKHYLPKLLGKELLPPTTVYDGILVAVMSLLLLIRQVVVGPKSLI